MLNYLKHRPLLAAAYVISAVGIGANVINRISKCDLSFKGDVTLEVLCALLIGTAAVTAADLLMYESISHQIRSGGFTHDVLFNERVRKYARMFAEANNRVKEYNLALRRCGIPN